MLLERGAHFAGVNDVERRRRGPPCTTMELVHELIDEAERELAKARAEEIAEHGSTEREDRPEDGDRSQAARTWRRKHYFSDRARKHLDGMLRTRDVFVPFHVAHERERFVEMCLGLLATNMPVLCLLRVFDGICGDLRYGPSESLLWKLARCIRTFVPDPHTSTWRGSLRQSVRQRAKM